jgi:16S rRNA (guanine527-N7)-methyltransferase
MSQSEAESGLQALESVVDVSRETGERLRCYADLLVRWQGRINLIGPATLPDLWQRHFLDSAQLLPLLPEPTRSLVDLGSGAGFPGLVLAILGVPQVHLVESDQRKVAFLRAVIAATGVSATIHPARIKDLAPFTADIVTARALAPLADLLPLALPFLHASSVCVFPKGRTADQELTLAGQHWRFDLERFPSCTDSAATILRLRALARRELCLGLPSLPSAAVNRRPW